MHPYCCNVNVVKLCNINHQHHSLAWYLTGLDGLAVEHAYWKGEVLGSNLCWVSKSVNREFGVSGQGFKDLIFFFLLTIFFAPYGNLRLLHRDHGTPENGPDIVSDIDYNIGGSHTPDIGTPEIGTQY
jgi:hypothetical protein